MTIWSILRPLEIFYGHLVYYVVTWYIFPRFGILDQEKSGNPAANTQHLVLTSNILRWARIPRNVLHLTALIFKNFMKWLRCRRIIKNSFWDEGEKVWPASPISHLWIKNFGGLLFCGASLPILRLTKFQLHTYICNYRICEKWFVHMWFGLVLSFLYWSDVHSMYFN
jgi:hypothetical protein